MPTTTPPRLEWHFPRGWPTSFRLPADEVLRSLAPADVVKSFDAWRGLTARRERVAVEVVRLRDVDLPAAHEHDEEARREAIRNDQPLPAPGKLDTARVERDLSERQAELTTLDQVAREALMSFAVLAIDARDDLASDLAAAERVAVDDAAAMGEAFLVAVDRVLGHVMFEKWLANLEHNPNVSGVSLTDVAALRSIVERAIGDLRGHADQDGHESEAS